ncbi:AAA family ATPase, partial [Bosea sp. (in: a-proteobacteria)]
AAAVAPGLGPVPGARILASDRLRKRRHGVEPQMRLPPEAYRPAVSEAVFAEQAQRALAILRLGHGVVADAVFDRAPDHERIARAAHEAGVAFQGLWLEAPAPTLIARVEARRGDPSDATGEIVRQQLGRATPVEDWRRLSTEAGPEAVCREARAMVEGTDRSGAA